MKKILLICTLLLCSATALYAQDDIETRAMRDELKRSMQDLHLDGTAPPYFISYKIIDTDRIEAQATLGALTSSGQSRSRSLAVSVRVGSYDSDSSGFATINLALLAELLGGGSTLPLDDNYEELRRRIWLTTDAAYKKAIEDLAGKRAVNQNRNRTEAIADFSKQSARQETETAPRVEVKLSDAERLVRSTSAVFLKLHAVESSDAAFEAVNTTEHFLNSEGTYYLRQQPEVYFHAGASLQRETGQAMNDSVTEFGRSMQDLPSEAVLTEKTEHVVAHLEALDKARSAKPYNGPVLFEGPAAAELFANHFANLLAARPATISGGGGGSSALAALLGGGSSSNSLLNRMGGRVLPDFLTVTDNPLLTQSNGQKLYGSYKFDEEGTPAQETVLVSNGILKTLLTSRSPVRGINHSSGNMRERGVLPSNLIVTATKTASLDQMKQQMLDIVKSRGLEYGMIIRRLGGGSNAIEAYRVMPDGREVMERFARVSEMTYNNFKDILTVSSEPTVYTARTGATLIVSAATRGDLVTYVVPAMLFEDVSLVHSSNSTKSTAIPSPF